MRRSPGLSLALAAAVVAGAALPAAASPRRVVALAPSAAEIAYALGATDLVVGVSDLAADLPASAGKARLGGFSPDLERVAALKPDLALVSRDGTDRRAAERLASLGIRVVVTDAASLDGVFADVRRVGAALGRAKEAERLVASLSARAAAAAARAPRPAGGKRTTAIALIWPDPPVVAGRGTFVGDLFRRAGLENAAPAKAGDWPRVTHETLVDWDPRIVVRPETRENAAAFAAAFAPGSRWLLLPAVREGRVLVLPGDWLERPGPRLVDALEALVERLREARW